MRFFGEKGKLPGRDDTEDAIEVGVWEMAAEHPELVKWKNGKAYFTLKKTMDDGSISTVDAAYNPYMHSSNTVLNDQFSSAYSRPNLVVVESRVPVSEMDGAYQAENAHDATGWREWKSGIVATDIGKQNKGFRRDVFLSRYIMPVRILDEAEVADKIAGYLEGTDVTIPFQCAWPKLREALIEKGVPITEPRGIGGNAQAKVDEAYQEWKSGNEGVQYALRSNGRYNIPFVNYTQDTNNSLTQQEKRILWQNIKNNRNCLRIYGHRNGQNLTMSTVYHGDNMKICLLERMKGDYNLLDVYTVNVADPVLGNHIGTAQDIFRREVKKYGREGFNRLLGNYVSPNGEQLFTRYSALNWKQDEIGRTYSVGKAGNSQEAVQSGDTASSVAGVSDEVNENQSLIQQSLRPAQAVVDSVFTANDMLARVSPEMLNTSWERNTWNAYKAQYDKYAEALKKYREAGNVPKDATDLEREQARNRQAIYYKQLHRFMGQRTLHC